MVLVLVISSGKVIKTKAPPFGQCLELVWLSGRF
jgi:hypothetical protein